MYPPNTLMSIVRPLRRHPAVYPGSHWRVELVWEYGNWSLRADGTEAKCRQLENGATTQLRSVAHERNFWRTTSQQWFQRVASAPLL